MARNKRKRFKHIHRDKLTPKPTTLYFGGGQDYEQEIIQDDLLNQKGEEIRNAVKNDKVFLAICGGYQL